MTFPEPVLVVRPLRDPVIDLVGHDPRSRYVEQFWLSILGPSATLLVRRLAHGLAEHPDGFDLDTEACARELGLGTKGGKHSPFWRALDRICRFGVAQRSGDMLQPRTMLPTLSLRQIKRLPPHLQVAHEAWATDELSRHERAA